MRHNKKLRRLGVDSSKRKALLQSLNTALAEKGKIKTTLARAKEVKREFDKLITLGKKGSLHCRRRAYGQLYSTKAVSNIFDLYAPIMQDRQGGYTRIYKIANRLGDNAEMALIQLVDLEKVNFHDRDRQIKEATATKEAKSAATTVVDNKFETDVIKEVKEELLQQPEQSKTNTTDTDTETKKD